jgi:hypothetical protein
MKEISRKREKRKRKETEYTDIARKERRVGRTVRFYVTALSNLISR